MELYQAPRHRSAIRSRRLGFLKPIGVIVLLVWLLWLALAAFGPAPAHADTYNPVTAAERKQMLRLVSKTEICMYDGSVAVFRQGVQERHGVTMFTMGVCGKPLFAYLKQNGWSEEDAARIVIAISDKAYDNAISWGLK